MSLLKNVTIWLLLTCNIFIILVSHCLWQGELGEHSKTPRFRQSFYFKIRIFQQETFVSFTKISPVNISKIFDRDPDGFLSSFFRSHELLFFSPFWPRVWSDRAIFFYAKLHFFSFYFFFLLATFPFIYKTVKKKSMLFSVRQAAETSCPDTMCPDYTSPCQSNKKITATHFAFQCIFMKCRRDSNTSGGARHCRSRRTVCAEPNLN